MKVVFPQPLSPSRAMRSPCPEPASSHRKQLLLPKALGEPSSQTMSPNPAGQREAFMVFSTVGFLVFSMTLHPVLDGHGPACYRLRFI